MAISTSNVHRDTIGMSITQNMKKSIRCKPQLGDFVGNVEVILSNDNDQMNNHRSIRSRNETNKNIETKHGGKILSEDEKTKKILNFIELMNSNKISVHKNDATIEKSLSEKCYDTHASMKKLDVLLEQGSYGTRKLSSPVKKRRDEDLAQNMKLLWDFKNLSQSQEKYPNPESTRCELNTSKETIPHNKVICSKKEEPARVTFHKDFVTNVVFFHPVPIEDRKSFFYTSDEMKQFRIDYMWELHNRMDEYGRLDEKGVEVWDAIQYYGENFLQYFFSNPK